MIIATDFSHELWDEDLLHSNWLGYRFPCARIWHSIPLQKWNPNQRVQFTTVPEFGSPGNLLPASFKVWETLTSFKTCKIITFWKGAPSDQNVYSRSSFDSSFVSSWFSHQRSSPLPSLSALLYEIYRQRCLEERYLKAENHTKETLQSALAYFKAENYFLKPAGFAFNSRLVPHKFFLGARYGPRLPISFQAACCSKQLVAAIEKEYNGLIERRVWIYVPSATNQK